jgi:predicted transcriptional regulator of viral defense system
MSATPRSQSRRYSRQQTQEDTKAFDRLSKTSAGVEGYFTRADARATGASDAFFDALVSEHKVEEVATDVFHITHFPRSDDEELIALWLQTDRKGVFSHETALFLHDLSDVLPLRRNITVPPRWSPGERGLAPDVVLHQGEVSEDELRWLGPVPYTAPLRTLRDCVEVSVSPDLIEQTVAAGLQRGLFTEAELPPGVRARAA